MNASNNQIETIERYLNRQLSPGEKVAFEHKMTQDAALSAEVAQHNFVHELIADRGLLDIKQKMQDSRYDQYFDQPKGNNYLYGGIGFGLLLISVASYIWYVQPTDKTATLVATSKSVVRETEISHSKSEPIPVSVTEQKSAQLPKGAAVSKNKKQIVANVAVDETIESANTVEPIVAIPAISTEKEDVKNTDKVEINVPDVIVPKAKAPAESKTEEANLIIQKSPTKNIEYAFSPSLGQVWEFPIEESANCHLTILNKSGQLVHETNILNGLPDSWNGISNRGMSITMGSYIYLFEYQNGQVERGYVTVTQ